MDLEWLKSVSGFTFGVLGVITGWVAFHVRGREEITSLKNRVKTLESQRDEDVGNAKDLDRKMDKQLLILQRDVKEILKLIAHNNKN